MPETVNNFTSKYYRVSRLQTTELSEPARQSVFKMAIAREWMGLEEGRDLKYFLSKKPCVGWPIMHALKALCQEIRHRDDLISEIKQNGGSIIEGIEKLKDVVSRAATRQFYHLCQQQSKK